jgi:hypothetical protein
VYGPRRDHPALLRELVAQRSGELTAGSQFDPDVVAALEAVVTGHRDVDVPLTPAGALTQVAGVSSAR